MSFVVGDEAADVVWFRGLGKMAYAPGVSLFVGKPIDPKLGYRDARKVVDDHRVIPGYRVRLHTADWNGDGKLDLLVGNCESGNGGVTGNVYVLLRQ